MKILVAPDSFKGSLSAQKICDIVEGVSKRIIPRVSVTKLPMADGGEGTVSAVIDALDGKIIKTTVKSPDFCNISVTYGVFDKTKAVMDMAEASGITKVVVRNIFKMNTFGTGQMVIDAINRGVDTIYLGIGGSATNDLGIGFASAIGVRFLDKNGNVLEPIPRNFELICDFDDSQVHEKIKDTRFIIMSDVKNPLLGKTGATHVFARQKGASDSDILMLEKGMKHVAYLLERKLGKSIANEQGSGAAGGLGAALLAFTNCEMQSGVETVLEITDFKRHLIDADLVITGEGKMDYQSAFGKVAYGVGNMCKQQNVPCIAIVGSLGENYQDMYKHGISSIITTVDGVMELSYAIENATVLCENATERALRMIKIDIS